MEYYQQGNDLYGRGNVEAAISSYSQALNEALSEELQVKVLMNRGQCYLRCERYGEAISDCSSALGVLSSDLCSSMKDLKSKALLRRSQAHELIGNYTLALMDVELALDGSMLTPSLQKTAIANRSRLRKFVSMDQKVSHSEGRPVMMVTNQQALRLGFILEPPREIILSKAFSVRLCIGNELGLWDRNLLLDSSGEQRHERPTVVCSLITALSTDSTTVETLKVFITTSPGNQSPNDLRIGENGKVDLQVTVSSTDESATFLLSKQPIAVILRFALDIPLPNSGDVLPLLSLPAVLHATKDYEAINTNTNCGEASAAVSTYQDVLRLCDQVHANCIREINVSISSNDTMVKANCHGATYQEETKGTLTVYALESPGYLGIAGKVWDSMYVLLQYLSQHTDRLVRDKTIIELGCGTGLAGISLCSLNPRSITLTDMDEVLPLINANVLLNSIMISDPVVQTTLRVNYQSAAYCWGDSLKLSTPDTANRSMADVTEGETLQRTSKVPFFDVILASDVVYYPEGYAPLLTTLCDLLEAAPANSPESNDIRVQSPTPVCILAHRHRHPEDKRFFDALYSKSELSVSKLDFKARHSANAAVNVEALNDVILFEITKRIN